MASDRISRDNMLMSMAIVASQRGTCSRLRVGAIVSRRGRIISTGYNGAPSGLAHCEHDEFIWPLEGQDLETPNWLAHLYKADTENRLPAPTPNMWFSWDGSKVSIMQFPPQQDQRDSVGTCTIAEHAERNAIAFAARYGVALEGAEMHTTHAPCIDCARSIINSGIQIVKFQTPYRLTAGVDLLRRAGLAVVDMSRTAK